MSTTNDKSLRDLWYRVAELVGYTVEVYPKGKGFRARLVLDGDAVIVDHDVESEEFAHKVVQHHLPDWPFSTDEALSLPFPDGQYLFMAMGATGRAWLSPNVDGKATSWDDPQGSTDIGLSPQNRVALAICYAWLAWQDSKQAEDGQ